MASTLDNNDNAHDAEKQEADLIIDNEHEHMDEKPAEFKEENIYFDNDETEHGNSDKPALYSVNLFENWCRQNGEELDLKNDSPKKINRLLSNFYPDVRSKTGEPYSHSTLCLFRYGLNRYIQKELARQGSKIDIIEDPEFKQANRIFRHVVKVMKEHNPVHEAQIITPEHIRRIYSSYAFSLLDPKCLLYKVWFEITVFFGKPKHDQQRTLKKVDFVVDTDENGCRYVTKVAKKNTESENRSFPRMYEKRGDPQCPVISFEKYLSKLDKGYIYLFQRPKDKTPVNPQQSWYMPMSPGKNFMFRMMSRISKLANLDTIFTNSVLKKLHRGLLIDMFLHRHDMIHLSATAKVNVQTSSVPDSESTVPQDDSSKQNSNVCKEAVSSVVLGSYRPILPADAKESANASKNVNVSGSLHRKLKLVNMFPGKQNEESVNLSLSASLDNVSSEKESNTKSGVEEAKSKIKMIFQDLDYPDLVKLDAWLKKVEVLKDTTGKVICRDPTPVLCSMFTQFDNPPKHDHNTAKINILPKINNNHRCFPPYKCLAVPEKEATKSTVTSKEDNKQKEDSQTEANKSQRQTEAATKNKASKRNESGSVDQSLHRSQWPSKSKKSDQLPKDDVTTEPEQTSKGEEAQKCEISSESGVVSKSSPLPSDNDKHTLVLASKLVVKGKEDSTPKIERISTYLSGRKCQENGMTYPNIISKNRKKTSSRNMIASARSINNSTKTSSATFSPCAVLPMNPAPVIGSLETAAVLSSSTGCYETLAEQPDSPFNLSTDIQVKVEPGEASSTSTVPSEAPASADTFSVPSKVETVLPTSNTSIWHIPQIPSHQVADIKPERDILSLSVLNPNTLIMHSLPRTSVSISDSPLAQRLIQFPRQTSYYIRNIGSLVNTGSIGSVVPSITVSVAPAVSVSSRGTIGSGGSTESVIPAVVQESIYIPESQLVNQAQTQLAIEGDRKDDPRVTIVVSGNADNSVDNVQNSSLAIKTAATVPIHSGSSRKRKSKIVNMVAKKRPQV